MQRGIVLNRGAPFVLVRSSSSSSATRWQALQLSSLIFYRLCRSRYFISPRAFGLSFIHARPVAAFVHVDGRASAGEREAREDGIRRKYDEIRPTEMRRE